MARILEHFDFAAGGNGTRSLAAGWGAPDPEHTWSVGPRSVLRLPFKPPDGDLQLQLDFTPFMHFPLHMAQRVEVSVQGRLLASDVICGRTWMGFGIDRARLDGTGVLQVEFTWPDAKSPADFGANADRRKLGIALYQARLLDVPRLAPVMPRRRGPVPIPRYTGSAMDLAVIRGMTGLGPAELALSLESLGLNCEFGLFQRRCGVEPLGLLRFTGIALGDLIAGLEAGFAGLEDIGNLSCRPDDDSGVEWIIRNNKYRLEYHTNRSPLVTAAADILRQQQRILPFRRAKLRDVLATGEKLFVVSRPEGMTQAQALPLLTALRDHGPNALLFASDSTGLPPGTVDMLAPGLFRGSMDGLDRGPGAGDLPGNVTWLGDAAFTAWLSICANAYRLWREQGFGAPQTDATGSVDARPGRGTVPARIRPE